MSENKKFSISFTFAAGHARNGIRVERERGRDCSGRRSNGKSARYYDSTLISSPEKGRQTCNREEKNGSSFSRSAFPESYAPNTDTLMLQKYRCFGYKASRGMSFLLRFVRFAKSFGHDFLFARNIKLSRKLYIFFHHFIYVF